MTAARLAGPLAFALALSASSLAAAQGFAPVEVRTTPIEEFLQGSQETRFGDLEFLGGLQIGSGNADFGRFSGLAFAPDGTLVAVADTGFWFSARLAEDNGRPTGLTDTRIAPMLGEDGEPPGAKIEADAEGLRLMTRDGTLTAFVSFEQTATVRKFTGQDFAAATPERMKLPGFVRGIRRNQGLEAIAVAPPEGALAGAMVVIAERSLDDAGNHRGFILGGPKAGVFSIKRSDEFDVTDAAFLANGDLLVLERRFSYSGGFAMRLRRIAGNTIAPGRTLDGTVLLDADSRYQIDNMEGLAVRDVGGETILTLVSDDNGNMLQRTILLQFVLHTPTPPLPHLRPTSQ